MGKQLLENRLRLGGGLCGFKVTQPAVEPVQAEVHTYEEQEDEQEIQGVEDHTAQPGALAPGFGSSGALLGRSLNTAVAVGCGDLPGNLRGIAGSLPGSFLGIAGSFPGSGCLVRGHLPLLGGLRGGGLPSDGGFRGRLPSGGSLGSRILIFGGGVPGCDDILYADPGALLLFVKFTLIHTLPPDY